LIACPSSDQSTPIPIPYHTHKPFPNHEGEKRPLKRQAKISSSQVLLLTLLASAALADNPPPPPSYNPQPSYADVPAQYTFEWQVKDDYASLDFGQQEQRQDANAEGSYYVALPDGRLQKVAYRVDGPYGGFVADITYEGEAQYPEEPAAAPSYARPQYQPAPPQPKYPPPPPPKPEPVEVVVDPAEETSKAAMINGG